jgi:hypothetical protein
MDEDEDLKELEETELDDETAEELPDREALSIVDIGESLGPPPLTE